MPYLPARRFVLVLAAVLGLLAVAAMAPSPASAHNTLVSSDPADGATLAAPPAQITWMFDLAVPLESMTVTLIDAAGVRTELNGSSHGASGETEVVTPLPTLAPGPISVRWRLVGPDGHPITGRVDLTIAADVTTTVAAATAAAEPPPAVGPSSEAPSTAEAEDAFSTPSAVRWVMRAASYLAIMAVVGILLTGQWVWAEATRHPLLRHVLGRSLVAIGGLGLLQLLVIASDVSGEGVWTSFGSIDAALATDAGRALLARVVIAATMWLVIFRAQLAERDVYWSAVGLATVGLLGTWAFAGHARSQRWPVVGVVTDIAHHGAAAVWLAGLAVIAWIVLPRTEGDVMVSAVRRFSRVAATSVAVLVVTGLVQSVRLVGNPLELFDTHHGRYLAVKLVALAGMLVLAAANRRRIAAGLARGDDPARRLGPLRRAIRTEFGLGLVIIAITAAMVVSPPASGTAAPAALELAAPGRPST